MPHSKIKTLFYDAGYTWTCGVCKHTCSNKNSRGINMMKKLHFKAKPNCKNKSCKLDVSRQIVGSSAAIVAGNYDQAIKQDTLLTRANISKKSIIQAENLTIEHNENR